MIINLNAIGVSLFLAYTLSRKLSTTDEYDNLNQESYNVILVLIMLSSIVTTFVGKYISNQYFMGINKRLHNELIRKVLNTKLEFYEVNTHGRILNRFSKDVNQMDKIVFTFLDMVDYIIKVIYSTLIIVISCPYLIILVLMSCYYLKWIRRITMHCTRDTYRLKALLMSPINSLI